MKEHKQWSGHKQSIMKHLVWQTPGTVGEREGIWCDQGSFRERGGLWRMGRIESQSEKMKENSKWWNCRAKIWRSKMGMCLVYLWAQKAQGWAHIRDYQECSGTGRVVPACEIVWEVTRDVDSESCRMKGIEDFWAEEWPGKGSIERGWPWVPCTRMHNVQEQLESRRYNWDWHSAPSMRMVESGLLWGRGNWIRMDTRSHYHSKREIEQVRVHFKCLLFWAMGCPRT